jgi:hypothetical protein
MRELQKILSAREDEVRQLRQSQDRLGHPGVAVRSPFKADPHSLLSASSERNFPQSRPQIGILSTQSRHTPP